MQLTQTSVLNAGLITVQAISSRFNSHVYRHHRDALGLMKSDRELPGPSNGSAANNSSIVAANTDIDPSPSTYENYCFEGAESDNQLPEPQSMVYDMWHLLGISQEQQRRTAASFLLKLREVNRVSEKSIDDIITALQSSLHGLKGRNQRHAQL